MNARRLAITTALTALTALATGCGYQPHAIPATACDVAFPRGAIIEESSYVDPQGVRVSWAFSNLGQAGARLVVALTPPDGEVIEPGDHTAPVVEAFRAAVAPHGCTEGPSKAARSGSLEGRDVGFGCTHGSLHARVLSGSAGLFLLVSAAHHEMGIDMGPDTGFLRSLTVSAPAPSSARVVPSPAVSAGSLEPLIGRLL